MQPEDLTLKKHFTTSAFVVNKKRDKTLLILHKKIKRWIYAGGHLEENETPDKSVLRELREETGTEGTIIQQSDEIDLTNSTEVQLNSPYCVLMMKIKESSKEAAHYHMDLVFLVEVDEQADLSNDEDLEMRWFTLPELLDEKTFDSIKNIGKKVLNNE